MAARILSAVLSATVLIVASSFPTAVQAQSPSTSAPGQPITVVGTVKRVQIRLSRVILTGTDRRDYTLDISHAKVTVPVGAPLKLTPGMRAYVSGEQQAGDIITVSRLRALSAAGAVLAAALPTAPETTEPPDLTVRGTVEAVDFEQGAFVLRISTHTRIVFVTADTNLSGISPLPAGRFPVQPGQRVTVGGSLQPNGTVLAGLLTLKGDPDYQTPPGKPNRVLIGVVSSPPNKLRGRDIKLRAADGTETKVQVPRGIPIRRSGRSISVYDLSRRDTVRITGRISGPDFQAARIEVLAPLPVLIPADPPPSSSTSPARPGL